jgi:ribosomal protein S18 acetylase RimI-like enzyme
MKDPVSLCAEAVAGWHASWLTALGLHSESDGQVWRALEAPPFIYFAAITLRPDVPEPSVALAPGSICDAWQTLDLKPFGFRVWRREPWFIRHAGPVSVETPPELEIVRVTTAAGVEELELVSTRGFGSEDATIRPGFIHPPAILDDRRMVLWLGRVDGKAVGAAMSYRTDEAVGIFGVTTIASARRRGYGGALTRAAMLADEGLPAILAPSEEGEDLYRGLGFEQVGELSIWSPQV